MQAVFKVIHFTGTHTNQNCLQYNFISKCIHNSVISVSSFLPSFPVSNCTITIVMPANSTTRKLLLLSSSTLHGSGYLEFAKPYMSDFLNGGNVKSVLFVPYALRDMDSYAEQAR